MRSRWLAGTAFYFWATQPRLAIRILFAYTRFLIFHTKLFLIRAEFSKVRTIHSQADQS